MSNGSKYYDCPEAATGCGGCCMGAGWQVFTRPVCDGVEMYCAPAASSDDPPLAEKLADFGTPEALEGY